MAIKQLQKTPISANLADGGGTNDGTLKVAAIFPVDSDGTILDFPEDGAGYFLLNPSTFTETKSSNWAQQTVPGQSDPILQWTGGGPRTVSFSALVTRDTSNYLSGQNLKPGKSKDSSLSLKSVFGDIAASFSKTTLPQPRQEIQYGDQLDVSAYLDYYRSLLYPTYAKNGTLTASPPLIVLFIGKALSTIPYGSKITTESDVWVITNLEIQVTKQLPNLAPMEALVNFQLTQYTIKSFGRDKYTMPR